jgi:predicted RND superfamily exporter protein
VQEAYVADSESSSIRVVNLKTGGSRLIAGGDPLFPENLFRVLVESTCFLYSLSFLYIFLIIFFFLVN